MTQRHEVSKCCHKKKKNDLLNIELPPTFNLLKTNEKQKTKQNKKTQYL